MQKLLQLYEALGGKENVVSIDNCATRLRLEVKDSSIINDKKIKQVAAGIIKPSKTDVQVIIGPLVEFVANEMKRTAEFIRNISNILNKTDEIRAIENSK